MDQEFVNELVKKATDIGRETKHSADRMHSAARCSIGDVFSGCARGVRLQKLSGCLGALGVSL